MIWVRGKLVPDDSLKISALDRSFEHGLGLFETLRTWNGRASLLPLHLERLRESARALRLPLDPESLPTADDITNLVEAGGLTGDCLLRITLTGGLSDFRGSTLWIRATPLANSDPIQPPWSIAAYVPRSPNPLLPHKTLNYWWNRLLFQSLDADQPSEVLFTDHELFVWEGTRTNLFLVRDGTLFTPGPKGPFLAGIMGQFVRDTAASLDMEVISAAIPSSHLDAAEEIFLTNSVRGIVPISRIPSRELKAPGPWTERLRASVLSRLLQGEFLPP